MAINIQIAKRWSALVMTGILPTVAFYVGLIYANLWVGLGVLLCAILICVQLASMLLRHPFTEMIEGRGILGLELNSTGILQFFIWRVQVPYMRAKINGQQVADIFDREAVIQVSPPITADVPAQIREGEGMMLTLTKEDFNKSKFQYSQYPAVIFNSQLGTVLTKDWLAMQEKTIYAEHNIIYLRKVVEELSSNIRDFARYVVEALKPKSSIFGAWWFWLIIIVFLGILAFMFLPGLMTAFKPAGQAIGNLAGGTGGQTITPK